MESLIATTITLMTGDLDASVSFYTKTLGLPLLQRYGNEYAEIDSAGVKIGLHPTTDSVIYGSNQTIGLGVLDFDGVVHELEEKGIVFEVEQGGWMRLAHFQDPDGNNLYLADLREE